MCIFNVLFYLQSKFIPFFYLSNTLGKDWIIETSFEILLLLECIEFLPSFCTYQFTDTLARPIIGESIHPLVISQDNIADATEKSN